MQLHYFEKGSENGDQTHVGISPHMPDPIIEVQASETEQKTFGLSVATIDVVDSEKGTARFSFTVKVVRGRPVLKVYAHNDRETSKSITGTYRKR